METITCPSGLTGSIRGLKVRDEDTLLSGGVSAAQETMNQLLKNCWVSTDSPGVYAEFPGGLDPETKALNPDGLLQGDRMFYLIQLRRISYGNDFDFEISCTNDFCGKKIIWEFQLSDMPVQKLSDEATDHLIKDGNKFPVDLPGCGKKAYIRLLTGKDEKKLAMIKETNKASISSAILRTRLVEVEGIKRPDLEKFVMDLEGIDAKALRASFEKWDCGVDTTIQLNCPTCKARISVELPLADHFLGQGGTRRNS